MVLAIILDLDKGPGSSLKSDLLILPITPIGPSDAMQYLPSYVANEVVENQAELCAESKE